MNTDIFTEVEIKFINQIFSSLQFKAGQSEQIKVAEQILMKIAEQQNKEED